MTRPLGRLPGTALAFGTLLSLTSCSDTESSLGDVQSTTLAFAGRTDSVAIGMADAAVIWGGRSTASGEALADGYTVELDGQVVQMPSSPLQGRWSAAATRVSADAVAIIGGYTSVESSDPLHDGAILRGLDTGDPTWESLPPLPEDIRVALPSSAAETEGVLVVAVELLESGDPALAVLEPNESSWVLVDVPTSTRASIRLAVAGGGEAGAPIVSMWEDGVGSNLYRFEPSDPPRLEEVEIPSDIDDDRALAVAVLPDGRPVATYSGSGTVVVWIQEDDSSWNVINSNVSAEQVDSDGLVAVGDGRVAFWPCSGFLVDITTQKIHDAASCNEGAIVGSRPVGIRSSIALIGGATESSTAQLQTLNLPG